LVITLFRVAISVATTKMILLQVDGGHIVQQFGQMVAGGNLVVGLVVFLIITVVQFVVISKGAERVAEVAARFSLDAMPGKQLSIDSDLRSGLLTKDEAREKRRVVEQESRLFGSLDGAMKFVKGDAIASIVIVLVNLVGGLAVGSIWHSMSLGEAATTFGVLTIGDGLVAQIPAFLCAMAAGLLVTRTTDEDSEADLAPAMARQITGKPHVLMSAGVIALLFAIVPGFPTFVFLTVASLLIGAGCWKHPVIGAAIRMRVFGDRAANAPAPEEVTLHAQPLRPVDALLLRIAPGDRNAAAIARLGATVEAQLEAQQAVSGIAFPAIRVAVEDKSVPVGRWALYAFDAPLGQGVIDDSLLDDRLPLIVGELLRRNAPMFLGLQEVTELLNALGDRYPEVVKEAVRSVPTSTIAEVLRLLAEELVSLRNLRDIIEAIATAGQSERDPRAITDRVRVALRRNIIAPLTTDGRLRVLMIGAPVEEAIRATLTMIDGQARLAIDPFQVRALIELLDQQIEACGARAILTASDLRRAMRLITAADLFDVAVISFNELNPAVPLDVAGQLECAPDLIGHREFAEAAE